MISKINLFVLFLIAISFSSCGLYSFTGASVEGKSINVYFIENNARLVAPTLSNTMTQKVRNKILNQTSLNQINSDKADYLLKGTITDYVVSIAGISGTQTVSQNRLTVFVEFQFINNIDTKKNFTRTYNKFADFDGAKTLQEVENGLIEQISKEIADVIFNDAFVTW
jgi:hypothetical protein